MTMKNFEWIQMYTTYVKDFHMPKSDSSKYNTAGY